MSNTKPRESDQDTSMEYRELYLAFKQMSNAYQAALGEIETLKNQIEVLSYRPPSELMKENEALKAKVAKYEDALKFYADHKNYSLFGLIDDHDLVKVNLNTGEGFESALTSVGKRARQALSQSNLPPDDNNCIQCDDL